jgi:hypothetical protein
MDVKEFVSDTLRQIIESIKDARAAITTQGRRVARSIGAVLLIALNQGCGPSADERYDVGYDDGYAVGYNTTCKIRATMIDGDFDNEAYSSGYRDGYADGERECREKD